MKFCILSTETVHHAYFINEILKYFDVSYLVYETNHLEFPYDTRSTFEEDEKKFEIL